jgi:hypothetical protein
MKSHEPIDDTPIVNGPHIFSSGVVCISTAAKVIKPTTTSPTIILRRMSGLEPIQEVEIHGQAIALVKRRSMILIIARRMKAATVLA